MKLTMTDEQLERNLAILQRQKERDSKLATNQAAPKLTAAQQRTCFLMGVGESDFIATEESRKTAAARTSPHAAHASAGDGDFDVPGVNARRAIGAADDAPPEDGDDYVDQAIGHLSNVDADAPAEEQNMHVARAARALCRHLEGQDDHAMSAHGRVGLRFGFAS